MIKGPAEEGQSKLLGLQKGACVAGVGEEVGKEVDLMIVLSPPGVGHEEAGLKENRRI